MELTSDLIRIQSILSSLIKNTGEFTRINYLGGNEDIILKIMIDIQTFLKERRYITEDNQPDEMYNRQLENIVLFLAINTSYKHPLEMEEYAHLLNITPPLSKCLFANVVYGLDLCKYYCAAVEKLPIRNSVELLDEVPKCLKKSNTDILVKYTNIFLKSIATKLSSIHYTSKVEEDVDNLCELTNTMLLNLSGINTDQLKNHSKDQIYHYMGLCLLTLFELLLHCDENCLALRKYIDSVMKTCCSIVRNVSLNVYCAWAETEIDEENLQTLIANKAYMVLETYQKLPESRDLMNLLGQIAKKPKSLTEQIYEADTNTIIKRIDKKDSDQKTWFKALIRTQQFDDKQVFHCVGVWSHLCDDEDLSILLNWCIKKLNQESVELINKCAAGLNLEKLTIVATKYFYKNKFINLPSQDVDKTLTRLLNKIKEDSDIEQDLAKDILILFLQQPTIVLTYLYEECIKNSFYTNILKPTFQALKEIIRINHLGATVLFTVCQNKLSAVQNIDNYIQLFNTLIDIEYFSNEDVLSKLLNPMLNKYYNENQLEELDLVLQIFLGGKVTLPIIEDTKDIVTLILKIMNENRCNFLHFDSLKQRLAKYAVDICCDVCKPGYESEVDIAIGEEDRFVQYYKSRLTSGNEISLFKNLCDNFNIGDYGNCVNAMLKFIPQAVNREWLVIAQEVIEICGNDKCLELFTDIIILLSQLVESQDVDKNPALYLALKYCVHNYGLLVQQKILDKSTLQTEVNVNRQICRLLAKLPNSIKEEEGLSLVNILTDRSLKSLAKDKEFLCHLILIKNPILCQVLAQRITK